MKRLLTALAVLAAAATVPVLATAAVGRSGGTTDGATVPAGVDTGSAIVVLKGDPLSTAGQTKPAPGKKIDFSSTTVRSYRAQLNAQRNEFKQWLRANAPKAKVTGEYDIALNAVAVELHGEQLATIASAPMALTASYEGLYTPAAKPSKPAAGGGDPDLALINAGGNPNAGAGVKVAVVDTGIDAGHPCFSDAGYSAQTQLGDTRFTNNKVIVAKVFHNKAGVQGYTPEAIQDHGTHVAGTVACDYGLTNGTTTVDGVSVSYGVTGVAPAALLGNYNVFPGQDANARSEDILNALEAAYSDGFDVANMSLGGGSSGIQDLLTMAVDNLDQANMVVAVAAGNEGPGHFTVSSPGMAERALTAGASTVGHFIGAPVSVGGSTFGAASGDFNTVTADLTASLGVVTGTTNGLSTACSALAAGSLTGKIALISRGVCTFSTKIRNAQNAGAIAVLVANNVAGDPVAMAEDGTANQPTVPAYMVGLATGVALNGSNGASATIGATKQYITTANSNIMAGFSSQGPTDVEFRVKPDVVAPGVNVLSSIPAAFCDTPPCWAFFQGTSMATPHLAGTAAVVRAAHSEWSAAQVRSAIVNTATQGVLKDFRTGSQIVSDPNIVGAGLENVAAALSASVALDPVSVSFGRVPAGSGQTMSKTITLSLGSASAVSVGASSGTGVGYAATLSGNTVTVTMSADKGAGAGDHAATLTVFSGGKAVAHAIVYTLVS